MAEDRRSARRAHVPAVRATYEGATGDRKEAEVFDLSRDGLFLKTDNPIPVGKRLSLEIRAAGQTTSWPALGRVIWTRTSAEGHLRPPGMAVKLIDVDDSVSEAIDRLVQAREPTDRGLGTRAGPPREKTILGVGLKPSPRGPAAATSAPPAPQQPDPVVAVTPPAPQQPDLVVAVTPPAPQQPDLVVAVATVIVSEPPATPVPATPPVDDASTDPEHPLALRGGSTGADPSIAIDLVSRKSDPDHMPARAAAPPAESWNEPAPAKETSTSRRPPQATAPAAHTMSGGSLGSQAWPDSAATRTGSDDFADTSEEVPPFVPKRRGRGLFAMLVLLIAAAVVAYLYQDALLAQWRRVAPALHRLLRH